MEPIIEHLKERIKELEEERDELMAEILYLEERIKDADDLIALREMKKQLITLHKGVEDAKINQ